MANRYANWLPWPRTRRCCNMAETCNNLLERRERRTIGVRCKQTTRRDIHCFFQINWVYEVQIQRCIGTWIVSSRASRNVSLIRCNYCTEFVKQLPCFHKSHPQFLHIIWGNNWDDPTLPPPRPLIKWARRRFSFHSICAHESELHVCVLVCFLQHIQWFTFERKCLSKKHKWIPSTANNKSTSLLGSLRKPVWNFRRTG